MAKILKLYWKKTIFLIYCNVFLFWILPCHVRFKFVWIKFTFESFLFLNTVRYSLRKTLYIMFTKLHNYPNFLFTGFNPADVGPDNRVSMCNLQERGRVTKAQILSTQIVCITYVQVFMRLSVHSRQNYSYTPSSRWFDSFRPQQM